MPRIIERQEAVDRINSILEPGECLACWILRSERRYVLHKGAHSLVVLSEFPRTWGQTMILLNTHKTSVSDTTEDEWREMMENVRRTSLVLERTLKPLRCYISSLGATENLPNTCPHLHFNVLPIYNREERPSDIFTWKNGVFAADEPEWSGLFNDLMRGWSRMAGDDPSNEAGMAHQPDHDP
ncbi:MAG: HIT family protein [Flavobacteriales bacterium]|nr:HIT family protein [Flavobacteriales bacterium]